MIALLIANKNSRQSKIYKSLFAGSASFSGIETTLAACEESSQMTLSVAPIRYLPSNIVVLESAFDPDFGILAAVRFQSAPSNQIHLISITPANQSANYLLFLGNLSWPTMAYDQTEQQLFLLDCDRSHIMTVDITCLDYQTIDAEFLWSDVLHSSNPGEM